MEPVIKRLDQDARRRARKAVRMWVEASAMLSGEKNRPAAVLAAISLNQEAIEECNRALNTLKFLANYKEIPAGNGGREAAQQ